MNDTQPTECVGSLLVHQSDMKELSAASNHDPAVECVGSLLVPTNYVKELSDPASPSLPSVNLKQRISVGTLLVTPEDVRSPEQAHTGAVTLQKRITNTLTGPSPPDEEAETWAD